MSSDKITKEIKLKCALAWMWHVNKHFDSSQKFVCFLIYYEDVGHCSSRSVQVSYTGGEHMKFSDQSEQPHQTARYTDACTCPLMASRHIHWQTCSEEWSCPR